MKILRILNHNIKDSFKSIFRNFSLSFASVSCNVITLILVSLAILASYNVTEITNKIEKDLTVIVFVKSDATQEELDKVKREISSIDNIDQSSLVFRSKEEIKTTMGNENAELKSIMDTWDESENPLQSTYVMKVININDIKETATSLKNIKNVTLVKYGETMVEKMINVFDIIKKVCIILVIALILVTTFLITNTIKITIFSRRNEINIMRLVGTSNTVIRLPFLFEGLWLGLIGSILPVVITIFGYSYFYERMGGVVLSNLVQLVEPSHIVYITSLVLLLVGSIVGMIGSSQAVRKYLKV